MMGAQLQTVAPPALVVVDGETSITVLAQRLWPATPIQRCWWHLPHGLRKAFYADDAADRHVNPRWARTTCDRLAELLREQIRAEHTTAQALTAWDEFTATIPAGLTSAHAYLAAARPHAFTCLDPTVRTALARLGGPELGTGVLERLMREINARTDIGGVRWTPAGLRDTLTVTYARIPHPAPPRLEWCWRVHRGGEYRRGDLAEARGLTPVAKCHPRPGGVERLPAPRCTWFPWGTVPGQCA